MMKFSQIRTALSRPDISLEYLQWRISKAANGGNARFRLSNGAVVSNCVSFSEYHSMMVCVSKTEIDFLTTLALTGPIVDVGANIGVVSLLLATQYPQNRVFSLEPAPTTFDALSKNVALNGLPNISCHQLALSDSVGEIAFDALPHQRGNARIADAKSTHVTMVRTTTLDDFVEEQGIETISLLKIDVEGFEASVLRGASKVLAARIPKTIFMEIVPAATISAGFPARLPIDLISDAGYDWFRLEANGDHTPVTAEQVDEIDYENWIAVPSS
jgi:FkbM family methyltransferase